MEIKEVIKLLVIGLLVGFGSGFGLGMYFYWQAIKQIYISASKLKKQ